MYTIVHTKLAHSSKINSHRLDHYDLQGYTLANWQTVLSFRLSEAHWRSLSNHALLIIANSLFDFTISTHLCGRIVETNGILFWSCGCGDKWSAQCYHKVGVNGAVCKQGITVHVQLHSQRNECTLVKIFDYSACELGNQKIQDWSWDDLASRTHRTTKTSSNVVEAQYHTRNPPRLFFWVSLKLQVKSWDGKPG